MKKLFFALVAMLAVFACNKPDVEETPVLEVSTQKITINSFGGDRVLNITSNNAWVIQADADWISFSENNGEASTQKQEIKVYIDENTAAEARTAKITVKSGPLEKVVDVEQEAASATPDPDHSEWALVGSFNEWNPASELYLSVLDEEYFVYYGFELAANDEFKFLKGGAWPPAGTEIGGNGLVEPNTIQPAGGSNIKVTEAGKYDIYLAADLATFYVMSEGKLPAEAVEPAPVENQWGMMGCFVDNQWATDVPMTKEGEWIVAKGAQFTELTFKIRANASWADATNIGRAPGSERAYVNAKIEVVTAEYAKANLSGDAADIKLDGEPGTYDVYFSFENLEVYVMEQGAKPGEKEPIIPETPAEITYTVVGTIAETAWVNNAEIGLMAKEGDYLVAKNIPFVWNSTCYGGDYNVIEFKILETGTWDGFAYPEKNVDQYANAEIKVQIGGENIALNAPEGSYDVYFDKANLKVWVMEAGFKPGEKEPLIPEEPEDPEQPELQKSEWALVGSFNEWNPKSDLYLSVLDENYFVYYGFDMPAGGEFKFLKGGVWPPEGQEVGGNGLVQPNTIQAAGGSNIKVNEAGKYDIYLAADLSKFYIMSEGKLPSEATEPAPVEKTWGMMGCFVDNQWSKDVPMTKEGEWIVAKGAQFTELTFKIRANESWSDATNIGLAPGSAKGEINTKVSVVTAEYAKANLGGDAADIKLNGEAGTYDVYFSYDNLELYVMTPGYMPGETPEPEVPGEMQGDGTEANPYILKTAEHMTQMRELAPVGGETWFKMANDIDLADVNWVPVNYDEEFKRKLHFDGCNYTISNLTCDKEASGGDYASLFGVLYGSCRNLKVDNATITSTNGCGVLGGYVGTTGLPAVVENVTITNSSVTNAGAATGGVCGNAREAKFTNVSFQGTVTGAGQDTGGFVGKLSSTYNEFNNCTVKATVVTTYAGNARCGGFIGWNSSTATTITDCQVLDGSTLTHNGALSKAAETTCGGFIGYGDSKGATLTITGCSADIDVDAGTNGQRNSCFIGQLAYASTVTITDSYATGNVEGNQNYFGGMIGRMAGSNTTTITNCHFSGKVKGASGVGGLVGAVDDTAVLTVTESSATGTVTNTANNCGGLVGLVSNSVEVTDSHFDGNIVVSGYAGGIVGGTGASASKCKISRSYSTGSLTASKAYCGGIFGVSQGVASGMVVEDCWSSMNLVVAGQQCGGIVGTTLTGITIKNCFSSGDIESKTSGNAGIIGRVAKSSTISGCIAWNEKLVCGRTSNEVYAPGAIAGCVQANGTYEKCWRRSDMTFTDMFMVPSDQEDINGGVPPVSSYSSTDTQSAYHGKAAAADATISSVAKAIGWSEDIWDLSGDVPVLK